MGFFLAACEYVRGCVLFYRLGSVLRFSQGRESYAYANDERVDLSNFLSADLSNAYANAQQVAQAI